MRTAEVDPDTRAAAERPDARRDEASAVHLPGAILREGRLGGCDPEALAREFGTPFYAYDLDVITRQVEMLAAALPPTFGLAYALKANPALGVVAHLASLGLGGDVASGGELATALRAGLVPERIVMTGPGKRDEELRAAVAAGIRAITVESPRELERLERLSAAAGRRTPVLLRAAVAPEIGLERVRLVGDAGAGKFGMGPDDLAAAARVAARSPHLRLLGLHAFGASNVLDAAALVAHVERTVEQARLLSTDAGVPLELVDAGGGLGIPYADDEPMLDLDVLARGLADVAAAMAANPVTRDTRVLFEPGRFLVGPAGAYVARVVDRKSVGGRQVAILDGGIHHLLRPALTGQPHRIRRLGSGAGQTTSPGSDATAPPDGPVTIAGPLCSGLDVLAAESPMPPLEPGDLVAVLEAGAYGFTESMPLFLSHPIPAEVAVRDGRAALLRPRREPVAWLDEQRVPDW